MSGGRADERLQERLAVLREITDLAGGRLAPDVAVRASATAGRAGGRLGTGADHTVVALAGATGSGKSSMFNALTGRSLAAVGVRRPTTSTTQAAVFAADATLRADAAALLDWLGIRHSTVIDEPALHGLVLLDLPDHDSTEPAHRQEVDRLVRIVDVFVWVVDPQKYADAVLHDEYLRRFAGHADVTLVVLNQLDTLTAEGRTAALEDLTRLLATDGVAVAAGGVVARVTGRSAGARVLGASARTGEGIDALRRELAARVSERRAVVARLDADLDWIAEDLRRAVGDASPRPVPAAARRQLGAALAGAAGVDAVADAVAGAHRHRGRKAAGWPPTRWLARLRPDPLRRLGLDRAGAGRTGVGHADQMASPLSRTSLPPPSPVAAASVSTAIRRLVDDASEDLPETWRQRIGVVATARRDDLDDELDRAVGAAPLPSDAPKWWSVLGAAQRLLAAALVVGLVWLLVIGALGWLGLPEAPTPRIGEIPLPTLLAVGGALLGLLLAAVAGWATGVGARRRGAQARRTLTAAATDVGERLIVGPVDSELRILDRLHDLSRRLRG